MSQHVYIFSNSVLYDRHITDIPYWTTAKYGDRFQVHNKPRNREEYTPLPLCAENRIGCRIAALNWFVDVAKA